VEDLRRRTVALEGELQKKAQALAAAERGCALCSWREPPAAPEALVPEARGTPQVRRARGFLPVVQEHRCK